MRFESNEVELIDDKETHGTHRLKAGAAARFAISRIEESTQGFHEAIGLAPLGSDDPFEIFADEPGNFLCQIDLRPYNIDLHALQKLGLLLARGLDAGSAIFPSLSQSGHPDWLGELVGCRDP